MIPKIIWQTYETQYEELPNQIKIGPELWIEKNPEWSYRYMDAQQRQEFVLKEYGKEWLDIFNKCPLGIMRANIWRFMILYSYGGVYADIDVIPKKPIDDWLNDQNNFTIRLDESEPNETMFNIELIASSPRNNILLSALNAIKDLLFNYEYPAHKLHKYDVYNFTGETIIYEAIERVLDPENKITLSSKCLDYNNLNLSKINKFYCYSYEDSSFNIKDIVLNSDGANNWVLGYTNWLEHVITKEEVRPLKRPLL
jgi:mannosyltransferase OCH1-like enzyme